MENGVNERTHLMKEYGTHVYKRRWWVVAVFSLFGFTQAMVWGTWGPIAESSEVALEWTDFNVAFPPNIACTCFVLTVLPMTTLSDTKGLRMTMLICTGVMLIGNILRCVSLKPSIITITSYICGALGGFSAAGPYACPALMSALWFPPNQRPMATALISLFNYCGLSFNFIIAPWLVPAPLREEILVNNTVREIYIGYVHSKIDKNVPNETTKLIIITNMDEMKSGIHTLLYLHGGLALVSFVLVLIYFPSRPPLPPSITASLPRVDYKKALIQILHSRPLWLVVIAGAMPLGVVDVWSVVLDVILKPIDVSQIDAGWMGFCVTLIGSVAGLVVSKTSELFRRRRKLVLIILFTCAAICCSIFALISATIVSFSLAGLYATCILMGVCLKGTIPLFYDISVEASYPIAEGVTGGFFTMVVNVFCITFLYLVAVPNIGTAWLNWVLLGSIVAALPLLLLFPETYKRLDIDMRPYTDKTEMEIDSKHCSKFKQSYTR